jgi:nucleoid-associated protein YgaU
MKLDKACFRVVDGDVSRKLLRFSFNPTEYTVAKSSSWNRPTTTSAKSTTKPQFGGAQPQTLTMEIFFDASETEKGDVTADVATLIEWVKPTAASVHKTHPQPPIVTFEWGTNKNPALANFAAYVKSVSAKYTHFRGDGTAVRATANVTLEEVPFTFKKTNPTSGALHSRRRHIMRDGDSLHSIAFGEYDDPTLWRALATFNEIEDPMRIAVGTAILIPSRAEAGRLV